MLKTRYSGFAGTTLDSVLRVREIRYLFFVGIATNVCVESTLRSDRPVQRSRTGPDASSRSVWRIQNSPHAP